MNFNAMKVVCVTQRAATAIARCAMRWCPENRLSVKGKFVE